MHHFKKIERPSLSWLETFCHAAGALMIGLVVALSSCSRGEGGSQGSGAIGPDTGNGTSDIDGRGDVRVMPDAEDAVSQVEPDVLESKLSTPAPVMPPNAKRFHAFREGAALRTKAVELRWRPGSAPCEQPTYNVRVDDSCSAGELPSCTFSSPELVASDVTADRFVLERGLPFRDTPPLGTRYFWQVRACCEGECSEWTQTRYFDLGRAKNDFNGDGLSDFTAVSSDRDAFYGDGDIQGYLYYGSPSGVARAPQMFRYNCFRSRAKNFCGRYFHVYHGRKSRGRQGLEAVPVELPLYEKGGGTYNFHSVGDINADGFDDLLLSSQSRGYVYVYPGSADGVLRKNRVTVMEECSHQCERFVRVGDVNADGYDDVLCNAAVHTFGCSTKGPPEPMVLFGSNRGLSRENASKIESGGDYFSVGVLDSDGFADVAAIEIFYNSGHSRYKRSISTLFGHLGGLVSDSERVEHSWSHHWGSVGDVDGDGLIDIVTTNGDTVSLSRGESASNRSGAVVDYEIHHKGGPPGEHDSFSALIAGDLDGDALDDHLMAFTPSDRDPYAIIFYGDSAGFRPKQGELDRFPRRRSKACGDLSREWMPVGDVNGDGFDDLFLKMRFHGAVCEGDEA